MNAENIKEDLLTLDLIEKILKFDFVKDLVTPEKATDKDIKKIEEYVQHSSNLKRNSFLNNILTTHEIHNVLGDGNCGIYAILEAGQRFENFRNLIQAREILNYNFTTAGNDRETIPQWQTARKFREFLFTPNENLYYMAEGLSDPLLGSRELSTDSLLHIAQRIGLTIVLVTEGNTLVEVYYPNGTIEIIDNNSHIKLNECICLYYHDNHFQAIVPKETLQGTPPN